MKGIEAKLPLKLTMFAIAILFLGLHVFVSVDITSADTDACGRDLDLGYRVPSNQEDSILEQLLLKGFRSQLPTGVNSFSLRQVGFTPEGSRLQCITVTYNLNTTANISNHCEEKNVTQWIYLWTAFNGTTDTGNYLLKLNAFDLRVYGFELCDAFNNHVMLNITLESSDLELSDCDDLDAALTAFTRLVRTILDIV